MARVLLYNFTEEARRKKVKAALFRYALPSREVAPGDQDHPLGYLLGMAGFEPAEGSGEPPFTGEMIVMQDLSPRQFNGFLEEIKRNGIRVPMKAVATEHNISWSSRRLWRELNAEHEAMTHGAGRPAHDPS